MGAKIYLLEGPDLWEGARILEELGYQVSVVPDGKYPNRVVLERADLIIVATAGWSTCAQIPTEYRGKAVVWYPDLIADHYADQILNAGLLDVDEKPHTSGQVEQLVTAALAQLAQDKKAA